MYSRFSFAFALVIFSLTTENLDAAIIEVAGEPSSRGVMPALIPGPPHILDNLVVNSGMQGFNEAQGVTTSFDYFTDSGAIPAGTLVNSHMIFLNTPGLQSIAHHGVEWTFDGPIIGVMSDSRGNLEADSSVELGLPETNYTLVFIGSGRAAPFDGRGLEEPDTYSIDGNSLTVSLNASRPGDWMRVVTAVARTDVMIDIKPGSDSNSINCKNENEVISVAILTTEDFDTLTVDTAEVSFEGAFETHIDKKTGEPRRHLEDVDGDGDLDLVFHFRLGDSGLTCTSLDGSIEGRTFEGTAICGTDVISMVPRGR